VRGLEGKLQGMQLQPLDELESQLSIAREKYRQVKSAVEAISEAQRWIEEAATRFGKKMAESLSPQLAALSKRILGNSYERIELTGDLEIRLVPKGHLKRVGVEYLSMGTRDQIYLLLRAAAVRVISCTKEPLPMLLDEPFVHYDDHRRRRAWEFLLELSQQIQLITFTCRQADWKDALRAGREKGYEVRTHHHYHFYVAHIAKSEASSPHS
jgi:uncharacterized protein YhaN